MVSCVVGRQTLEQTLAATLHPFLTGRPEWPHSSVRPRVQPHVCWPCWNGARDLANGLRDAGIVTIEPPPADEDVGITRVDRLYPAGRP